MKSYTCTCVGCGIEFTPKRDGHVFHSRECRHDFDRLKREQAKLHGEQVSTRVCNRCNTEKPVDMFHFGYKRCKQCSAEVSREDWQRKKAYQEKQAISSQERFVEAKKRKCERCGVVKHLYEFPRKPRSADYRERINTCQECVTQLRRERHDREKELQRLKREEVQRLKREKLLSLPFHERIEFKKKEEFARSIRWKYGLTLERYEYMLAEQKNLCAICGNPPDEYEQLFIDHDHQTGAIRGLLCTHCNWGLGNFKDNQQLLKNAVVYLQKHTWE